MLDDRNVKHYKVLKNIDGEYCIARNHTFRTLKDLVRHYSRDAGGLCVRLTKPCKKVWKRSLLCFSAPGYEGMKK